MTARTLGGMVVLAVWTAAAGAQGPDAKPAAVVNGEPISQAELNAVLKMVPPPDPGKPPTEAQAKEMRAEALDMLVEDALLRQFLTKAAPPVTKDEVAKEYNALLASLKARGQTLADFLRDTHQTEAHLRQDIVKKLQWDKYLRQHVREADLKKYYDDNRDFYDQVTVRVSHILIRVPAKAGEGVRASERARLLDLRNKIVAGQITFAEVAKKYSQCPSASRGGDIGTFIRKWAVDERIAKAAFALKVGEVSGVVETDYGLHLLTVTARNPGQPSNYEKIKDLVREHVGMEMWQNVLTQQRKVAKVEIK